MPKGICYCNMGFNVDKRDKLTCVPGVDEYCSPDCILFHIRSYENGSSIAKLNRDMLSIDGASISDILCMDKGEVYSEKHQCCFRSRWEMEVADWLTKCGISIMYEPFCFEVGEGYYCPDFLTTNGVFIEVKGKWGFGSKQKVKRFKDKYSSIPLIVIPYYLRKQIKSYETIQTAS